MVVGVTKDTSADSEGGPRNLSPFPPRMCVSWRASRGSRYCFASATTAVRPDLHCLLPLGQGRAGLLLFYLKHSFK